MTQPITEMKGRSIDAHANVSKAQILNMRTRNVEHPLSGWKTPVR